MQAGQVAGLVRFPLQRVSLSAVLNCTARKRKKAALLCGREINLYEGVQFLLLFRRNAESIHGLICC